MVPVKQKKLQSNSSCHLPAMLPRCSKNRYGCPGLCQEQHCQQGKGGERSLLSTQHWQGHIWRTTPCAGLPRTGETRMYLRESGKEPLRWIKGLEHLSLKGRQRAGMVQHGEQKVDLTDVYDCLKGRRVERQCSQALFSGAQ